MARIVSAASASRARPMSWRRSAISMAPLRTWGPGTSTIPGHTATSRAVPVQPRWTASAPTRPPIRAAAKVWVTAVVRSASARRARPPAPAAAKARVTDGRWRAPKIRASRLAPRPAARANIQVGLEGWVRTSSSKSSSSSRLRAPVALRRRWMRVARPMCTATGRMAWTAATAPSASVSVTRDQVGSSVNRVPRRPLSRSTAATASWVDCPESRSRAAVRAVSPAARRPSAPVSRWLRPRPRSRPAATWRPGPPG